MKQWVYEQTYDDAQAFLAALSPDGSPWGTRPDWWVYRGQADATWDLSPSAFRSMPSFDYGRGPYEPRNDHKSQVLQEALLMRLFVSGINEQGWELPTEAAFGLTNWMEIDRRVEAARTTGIWPPADLQVLFGLAQHYGLPTRLLDWSERAYVAAYFAAERAQAMRQAGRPPEHLAVWAYNQTHAGASSLWEGADTYPAVVRVARARNPNLHAQGGVFTVVVKPTAAETDPPVLPPLNRLVVERAAAVGNPPRQGPVLCCLRLRLTAAGELLRRLRYYGVSGTHLFPGYDGVVEGIKERALWDHITFPWDF